jgi:predicted regulator of Ras-like GTPase activity (Roadblock/LC7/MglB family)
MCLLAMVAVFDGDDAVVGGATDGADDGTAIAAVAAAAAAVADGVVEDCDDENGLMLAE